MISGSFDCSLGGVQIGSEPLRLPQVDVGGDVVRRGVVVGEHSDHSLHRPGDVELTIAEQRHAVEPDRPRADRRELGVEVVGAGEDHGDEVGRLERVAA